MEVQDITTPMELFTVQMTAAQNPAARDPVSFVHNEAISIRPAAKVSKAQQR